MFQHWVAEEESAAETEQQPSDPCSRAQQRAVFRKGVAGSEDCRQESQTKMEPGAGIRGLAVSSGVGAMGQKGRAEGYVGEKGVEREAAALVRSCL